MLIHLTSTLTYQRLIRFLKLGGIVLLEGFLKHQINNNFGGQKT